MTAPWSVEFQENVFVIVHDDIFVVVGYDNMYRSILLLRNRLRLDAWLNLAVNKVLDKFSNVLRSDLLVLVEGKLLVLDRFLDGEGGPSVDFKVEVTGMSAKCLCVDCCEADGTLVLLCDGFEGFGKFGTLLGGLSEDVRKGDTSLREKIISFAIFPCGFRRQLTAM